MAKILLIYSSIAYPPINNVSAHLRSLRKYSGHEIFHLNFFYSKNPLFQRHVKFDAVLLHYTLNNRWHRHRFELDLEALKKLDCGSAVKAAFFQDEYHHADWSCRLIREFGVSHVFSAASETEWRNIYDKVDFNKVQFHRTLTGYLEPSVIAKVEKARPGIEKTVDIGYRTLGGETYKTGRFGANKGRIADLFAEKGRAAGLKLDISKRQKDFLYGDAWLDFLLRCKYSIGVESGAGMLDRDGSISDKIDEYRFAHPGASFEEVEEHCFKGVDGNLNLRAISPRHFEACLTKTCQVLAEGSYNGILQPGKHYIELKKDFSNVDEVIRLIKDDSLRAEIADRAYRDIVASGKYTYQTFVSQVLSALDLPPANGAAQRRAGFFYRYAQGLDYANTGKSMLLTLLVDPVYSFLVKKLSLRTVNKICKFFKV